MRVVPRACRAIYILYDLHAPSLGGPFYGAFRCSFSRRSRRSVNLFVV
jgi:hypothetical protein